MEIRGSGQIIKALRKSRNMKQIELAEEICSVRELQRIENGESKSTLFIYEKILSKLGVNLFNYLCGFINTNEQMAFAMIMEIDDLIFERNYNNAEEKYNCFKLQPYFNPKDDFLRQFSLLTDAIFLLEIYNKPDDALQKAKQAIEITIPQFDLQCLKKCQLTVREYHTINTMAIIYSALNELEQCTDILYALEDSLNQRPYLKSIKDLLMPTICYNLSKYLGLQEKYDEAIVICNEGIEACREAKTSKSLGELFYNKAYCFCHVKKLDDAKMCFQDSFNIFKLYGNIEMAEYIKGNAMKKYGISLADH